MTGPMKRMLAALTDDPRKRQDEPMRPDADRDGVLRAVPKYRVYGHEQNVAANPARWNEVPRLGEITRGALTTRLD